MDSWKFLVITIITVLQFKQGTSAGGGWGYFGDDGPTHWNSVDSMCGGSSQSPINVLTKDVTRSSQLNDFQFSNYETTSGLQLTLKNNGHTAQMDISGVNVKISGGGLPEDYTAAQLHFHWGRTSSEGSEHQIDGKKYPLEMHIVHYKSAYGGLNSDALGNADGLAVLGVFFEIGAKNDGLQNIVDKLGNIVENGTSTSMQAFSVNTMLPQTGNYYRYKGSLTTPTCNPVVTWTLFTSTLTVSEAQMAEFRKLKSSETNDQSTRLMYNNYRPVQALNGRKVESNFDPNSASGLTSKLSITIVPILSLMLAYLY